MTNTNPYPLKKTCIIIITLSWIIFVPSGMSSKRVFLINFGEFLSSFVPKVFNCIKYKELSVRGTANVSWFDLLTSNIWDSS